MTFETKPNQWGQPTAPFIPNQYDVLEQTVNLTLQEMEQKQEFLRKIFNKIQNGLNMIEGPALQNDKDRKKIFIKCAPAFVISGAILGVGFLLYKANDRF